ncbi:hypothetical protein FRC12_018985 [Ceratobasidium sp. 428]|nr:hypothetical protein FRC12_018985 [Ceratobasidium sp. 428]
MRLAWRALSRPKTCTTGGAAGLDLRVPQNEQGRRLPLELLPDEERAMCGTASNSSSPRRNASSCSGLVKKPCRWAIDAAVASDAHHEVRFKALSLLRGLVICVPHCLEVAFLPGDLLFEWQVMPIVNIIVANEFSARNRGRAGLGYTRLRVASKLLTQTQRSRWLLARLKVPAQALGVRGTTRGDE